ncbi:MAG: hypothetical protein JO119_02310 [Acidobacteria bacterium]|nr:hypothetical protein [Acidobacteriota bacterium]
MVAHATPSNPPYQQLIQNLTGYFASHGFSHADSVIHAQARAFDLLQRQATLLAGLDCFTILGWVVLMGVPLVFLIKKFKSAGGSASAH